MSGFHAQNLPNYKFILWLFREVTMFTIEIKRLSKKKKKVMSEVLIVNYRSRRVLC